ncbi:MAG TPA: type II toxin-antitoxin system VapC family toxin [Anaerolineales bacterium]|nr:type II toxin-antitoxin system VapC family toxin [Anaerolineales bacterium]
MIVDASVLLHAFLPDELQPNALALVREHVAGRLQLSAPALLIYELSNAVWQAERRGRLTRSQADRVIDSFANLEIESVAQPVGEMLPLARQFALSAYDAAYLSLAQVSGDSFITGDLRLYHAVKGALDYVIWIGDYTVRAS